MDARKLMIGAWILYAGRYSQIDGMAEGSFSVHITEGKWVSILSVSPIPITPEVLEKNGFVVTKKERYQSEWKIIPENYGRTRYITNINCINGGYDFGCYCKGEFIGSFHLSFIHELQSALQLCEINREIEL